MNDINSCIDSFVKLINDAVKKLMAFLYSLTQYNVLDMDSTWIYCYKNAAKYFFQYFTILL